MQLVFAHMQNIVTVDNPGLEIATILWANWVQYVRVGYAAVSTDSVRIEPHNEWNSPVRGRMHFQIGLNPVQVKWRAWNYPLVQVEWMKPFTQLANALFNGFEYAA